MWRGRAGTTEDTAAVRNRASYLYLCSFWRLKKAMGPSSDSFFKDIEYRRLCNDRKIVVVFQKLHWSGENRQ